MKNWFKKITGIQKIEDAKIQAEKEHVEALARVAEAKVKEEEAKKAEELAKMTPKDRATAKGEAWVGVLDTKVNPDNIRIGFFELDWNPEFIVQLKQAGYGFDGDPEEEIVDRWFRDLARGVLAEEGQDPNRGMGYVNTRNINRLGNGKAEVE
jgi:nucleoid-associated protein YgaU